MLIKLNFHKWLPLYRGHGSFLFTFSTTTTSPQWQWPLRSNKGGCQQPVNHRWMTNVHKTSSFCAETSIFKIKKCCSPPKSVILHPYLPIMVTSSSLSTVPSCKVASTFILIVPLSLPLADKIATFKCQILKSGLLSSKFKPDVYLTTKEDLLDGVNIATHTLLWYVW